MCEETSQGGERGVCVHMRPTWCVEMVVTLPVEVFQRWMLPSASPRMTKLPQAAIPVPTRSPPDKAPHMGRFGFVSDTCAAFRFIHCINRLT